MRPVPRGPPVGKDHHDPRSLFVNTATNLPTLLTVEEAAKILGIGRTFAYELIRANSWPTPIVRIGRFIKIPSGPVVALLAAKASAES